MLFLTIVLGVVFGFILTNYCKTCGLILCAFAIVYLLSFAANQT